MPILLLFVYFLLSFRKLFPFGHVLRRRTQYPIIAMRRIDVLQRILYYVLIGNSLYTHMFVVRNQLNSRIDAHAALITIGNTTNSGNAKLIRKIFYFSLFNRNSSKIERTTVIYVFTFQLYKWICKKFQPILPAIPRILCKFRRKKSGNPTSQVEDRNFHAETKESLRHSHAVHSTYYKRHDMTQLEWEEWE